MAEANDRLFIQAAATLREVAHQQQPTLTHDQIETLLRAVVRLMGRYDGADDLEAFTRWALQIIEPGAALLYAVNHFTGEHIEAVRGAIRSVLAGCGDLGADIKGATLREIESTVWTKVFDNLDHWLTPAYSKTRGRSPASLRTRLYGFARLQAKGWKTDRLRHRARHGSLTEKPVDEKPSEKYPIVLGPGDDGKPEKPVKVEHWDIPLESEEFSDPKVGLEAVA